MLRLSSCAGLLCCLATFAAVLEAQLPFDKPGQKGQQTPLGPIVNLETPQLIAAGVISEATVAPGARLTISLDVTPRRGIHVYAPGKHTYRVVRLVVTPQPWLRAHPTAYPPSSIYHFKPLDERIEVYDRPFRLTQDVTVLATAEAQKRLAGQTDITLTARLEYQACDDKVCFAPQSVPLTWTLPLRLREIRPPQ